MGEAFTVNSEERLKNAHKWLDDNFAKNKYSTYSVRHGRDRSTEQNDMVFEILNRAYKTLNDTGFETLRAQCKLEVGVPILRRECLKFREVYDKTLKLLSYEEKLELFETMDFPITRLMSVKQMQEYINLLFRRFRPLGVYLEDLEGEV